MNATIRGKIRTVAVNERGQIVIPEEVRKDLGIEKASTLVLIEKGSEIVLRKESDVIERIEEEDKFWKAMARASLKNLWGKEDDVWDRVYKEDAR